MNKFFRGPTAIVLPLAFLVISYLLIYFVFSPVIDIAVSVFKMATTENELSEKVTDTFKGSNLLSGVVNAADIDFPQFSQCFGSVQIESLGIDLPLIFGDSDALLKKGLCQYQGSSFCGTGSTVLIGGHNSTFLYNLKNIKVGDKIKITTNYGVYVYEVTETAVKKNNDETAYNLNAENENLVLYTCHYASENFGVSANRFFVYGCFFSGPVVKFSEG